MCDQILNTVSEWLTALGEPIRLAIVRALVVRHNPSDMRREQVIAQPFRLMYRVWLCHMSSGGLLADRERTVSRIAEKCEIPMANMTHHLKVMRDAGIVGVVPVGRTRRYRLIGAQVSAGWLEITHESGVRVQILLDDPDPKKAWK